ncbi:D-alanyl-D-alanine carboxypeptidase family protein [Sulfobacillus harzensis]|nr:D-alanyl-D-alanine carboxypeptidase family protein [Sulfobacillus harzensis]
MRSLKLLVALMMGVMAAPFLFSSLSEAETTPVPPVSAKAVELVDGLSGKVLYQKNAYERLPMASVTKLMTLYLATRAVEQKKIHLNELVPVSEEAYHVNGSQIWLEPGERLSVDHLLKAVAIGSANDAAYALGEYIAGSPEAFVADMNQTARRLGMVSTHFTNPHGLHEPDHYTTAHDLALLAEQAVRQPLLLHYTSMWEDRSVRNGKGGTLWLINHNRLLRQYPGMDGLKTGYTSQAGFCMVATAKRDHTRMIAVVLGAPSSKARFQDAASLLTWGFQHYQSVSVATKGQVLKEIAVRRGTAKTVPGIVAQDKYLTLLRNEGGIERTVKLPQSLEAPVSKGQVIGHLVARQKGREVARVPIVAGKSVMRATWLGSAWRYLWKIAG